MYRLTLLFLAVVIASADAGEPMLRVATEIAPEDVGISKFVLSAQPGPGEVTVLRVESPVFAPGGDFITRVGEEICNQRKKPTEYPVIFMDRKVLFPDEAGTFVIRLSGQEVERMPDCSGFTIETLDVKSPQVVITLRRKGFPDARYLFRLTVERYADVKKRMPELPPDENEIAGWKFVETSVKKE